MEINSNPTIEKKKIHPHGMSVVFYYIRSDPGSNPESDHFNL